MATETVNVKFLSDTKGYVTGVKSADKATDDLTSSLKRADKAQGDFDDKVSLSKVSVDELGLSVKQTGEGALDSITGMSGLGAAISNIGTSAVTAVKSLSTFKLALIGTGIGAAIVALGAMVVYWDDITDAIGATNYELDRFIEKSKELKPGVVSTYEKVSSVFKAMGLSDKELAQERLDSLLVIDAQLREADKDFDKRIADRNQKLKELEGRSDPTQGFIISDEIKELNEAQEELNTKLQEQTRLIFIARKELEGLYEVDSVNWNEVVKQQRESVMLTGLVVDNIGGYAPAIDTAIDKQSLLNQMVAKQIQLQDEVIFAEEKAAADSVILADQVSSAKINAANAFADFSAEISEEQQVLQGGIMISQAIANGALAVTQVLSDPTVLAPAKPFFIASYAGIVASQIAVIAKNMGTGGGGGTGNTNIGATSRSTVETSLPENIRSENFVPVLVTDDFNRVNTRVKVVQDRGSLY